MQDEKLYSSNDGSSNLYALTTASVITPKAGGNLGSWDYDSTVSIKAYCTIYYSTKTAGGVTYYCLTSVSGSYEKVDSSVSVTSQTVLCVETGLNQTSLAVDKRKTSYPTSSSWSTNTGFSDYIFISDYGLFGAKYTLNLTRNSGASSWTFTLNTLL